MRIATLGRLQPLETFASLLDDKTHADILIWPRKLVAFAMRAGYAYVMMHPQFAALASAKSSLT